ncbi:MAG: hypothetical protein Kow006_05990 [Gammaproteobacteria bacterium]
MWKHESRFARYWRERRRGRITAQLEAELVRTHPDLVARIRRRRGRRNRFQRNSILRGFYLFFSFTALLGTGMDVSEKVGLQYGVQPPLAAMESGWIGNRPHRAGLAKQEIHAEPDLSRRRPLFCFYDPQNRRYPSAPVRILPTIFLHGSASDSTGVITLRCMVIADPLNRDKGVVLI